MLMAENLFLMVIGFFPLKNLKENKSLSIKILFSDERQMGFPSQASRQRKDRKMFNLSCSKAGIPIDGCIQSFPYTRI